MDVTNVLEELPTSKLGTQEYWNKFYKKELENFESSKDEGEVWFGYNQMMKIVKWIINKKNIERSDSILDIGCGNGLFLLELAAEGFDNLFGLDYSLEGIKLARNIAASHEYHITYQHADFVDNSTIPFVNKFKICHDKGTYDAISLRPDDAKYYRQKYLETLAHVLEPDGIFVITSCNWTLCELKVHLDSKFKFIEHIPASSFFFGGRMGATVSTAVFMLKS